jgi:glyoxylase-like metal-dependent hydrolase (beta-lactamase superfamily II)
MRSGWRSAHTHAGRRSSAEHTRAFLGDLLTESGTRPSAVVYTHSHWDHVLGGAEVGGLVIAHALTAERLIELAAREWSDEGLERRVAAGLASPEHVEKFKAELPSPRTVEVTPVDIVFHDGIEIDLGGVTVHVRHVGGDHTAESTVMFVEPDRVLFLGDCMYASPEGALTAESAFRLRDVILGFDAKHYVEGHHERSLLGAIWRSCSRRCGWPTVPYAKDGRSPRRTRTPSTSFKPSQRGAQPRSERPCDLCA